MLYIESNSTDPYFNLALEEFVFSHMDQTKQYFMLWQNDNTIVVGKYQNTAEEINQQYVENNGIRVVRRLSGGGAVYHDKGNLNFTFIVDQKDTQDFNFKIFVLPVIAALKKIGIKAEFNGRNDVTINGLKFSGNSQYARGGRVLHHGCIMLDSNLSNVADALNVKEAKYQSKAIKSVRSRVTTINAHVEKPVSVEEFKRLLLDSVAETTHIESVQLSEAQMQEVTTLRNQKYAAWEWNYGKSPAYNVHKERKFSSGLVTVYLQVKESSILNVRFYGDFFGNGDISELEADLEGLLLGPGLMSELSKLNIDYYMKGITAEDIYSLLMY